MKKNKRKIIGILCAIGACIFAAIAVYSFIKECRDEKTNQNIEKTVKKSSTSSESSKPAETVPIDFDKLQQTCPDAYAWIHIDGTDIDYPIEQYDGDDQEYYLNHSAEKKDSVFGAIFTQNLNHKDFNDPVTVIYGHNPKNGTMFRQLHKYEDRAFFDEHREILVYLPDKVLHFKVFAAYNTDDRHILMSYNFSNKESYQNFLDSVKSQRSMNAFVAEDVDVTTDSHIIVLSTCNGINGQRYLVMAVREDS